MMEISIEAQIFECVTGLAAIILFFLDFLASVCLLVQISLAILMFQLPVRLLTGLQI
jgi:hypothetical protein